MRILGIGTDIVEVARIAATVARQGERFLNRVFQAEERAYCERFHEPARCYAARFAVKEAVAKALGTGFGEAVEWLDVQVEREENGRPRVRLTGAGAATAARLGITEWHVSLSHETHYAVAHVVACGE